MSDLRLVHDDDDVTRGLGLRHEQIQHDQNQQQPLDLREAVRKAAQLRLLDFLVPVARVAARCLFPLRVCARPHRAWLSARGS